LLRIWQHRRFTANHTWYVNLAGHRLFVKASPNHVEAREERAGHVRLRAYYAVPRLHWARRVARWSVIAYDRWNHLGPDCGLLLDEITHADHANDMRRLDDCLTEVLSHYRSVIAGTLRPVTLADTIGKLYGDRAATDGRLDRYYRADTPWPLAIGGRAMRPSDLAALRLVVNGREHQLDFTSLIRWLRGQFAPHNPVWAAVTQGDPTDVNIGWSPAAGPIWFDYDTGGLNSLPGEFACFLLYQRLHGAWLTGHYNSTAFRDHLAALAPASLSEPVVHVVEGPSTLVIDYYHAPSPARTHVLRRYLDEIVHPLTHHLGISDLMDWLRPYLVMRLLAVYNLASLEPRDTAFSLALLADALDPSATLAQFLALAPNRREANDQCPVPSPSSPEPARASVRPSPHGWLPDVTCC
jgi:hypothetical protein